ncbi:MAG: TRAP-type mannitol/chloroaromatic compound transport system permease small subunit [Gammaproteobacteria bacterium]|jgi:TRAP-type mannitol/chloroaromatic compound transport system permease small subunit
MELPDTRFSRYVEGIINRIGELSSWVWLLLMMVIVSNVVMRYVFGMGRIEFEEIQWHLYAGGFLLGLSYAYVSDSHVRVDVVRLKLPPKIQAWIELYGTLLLLLPFIALILIFAFPFVSYSFATHEISEAPGGLPYRWIIKSFMIIGFMLLLAAMLARLSKVWSFLFGWPRAFADHSNTTGSIKENS